MSFSNSFLAARCDLDALQAAYLASWPTFELAEPAQEFPSWDEALRWASPRCEYLDGQHPDDAKLLYHDGEWSVLTDISMCMPSDQSSLVDLSRRVGRLVVASTQGTVGFAQLLVLDGGAITRSLTGEGGRVTLEGAPLPQEAGVPLDTFYLDELDIVWQRLGLSSFLKAEPLGPCRAVHVLDRTVYPPAIAAAMASPSKPGARKRPWWKLW